MKKVTMILATMFVGLTASAQCSFEQARQIARQEALQMPGQVEDFKAGGNTEIVNGQEASHVIFYTFKWTPPVGVPGRATLEMAGALKVDAQSCEITEDLGANSIGRL